MSKNNDLTDGLDKQSYQIEDELKIRKTLEAHTDWQFEFTKNGKYAYDLEVTGWADSPQSDTDNQVIGYVEIERSRNDKEHSWVTGDIPDSWYYLSFLQRKVRKYDYRLEKWCGLKDHYDQTVYLKFNHALNNCFVAPITAIHRDGNRTKRSDGSPQNTYLALNHGHSKVHIGINDCVAFIKRYLTRKDPSQSDLEQWASRE